MRISAHPDLTVVVVNHRSVAFLENALRSFCHEERTGNEIEVIVANNDPNESESVETLSKRLGFHAIELSENRGFGAAANVAAAAAHGDILCFLNPDTEFHSGSLESVLRMFCGHREVGIIGAGLVSGKDDEPEPWSAGETLTFRRLIQNKIRTFFGWKYRPPCQPIATGWVSGGALFIRRDLFESLKGFDTGFFLYFEDMDLCLRSREIGYHCVLLPSLSFVHSGGSSRISDASRKAQYFASQDRFFAKHRPKWEGILIRYLRSLSIKS
ncbi:MAG TPA: glycosyltransferase family 2 protein [Candidatus Fimivivens sp.]|nr:glycosyltransferase family 2 protein [Candidatus Fimivivens sp.]